MQNLGIILSAGGASVIFSLLSGVCCCPCCCRACIHKHKPRPAIERLVFQLGMGFFYFLIFICAWWASMGVTDIAPSIVTIIESMSSVHFRISTVHS